MKNLLRTILIILAVIICPSFGFTQDNRVSWMQLSTYTLIDTAGKTIYIRPSKLTVFVLLSPQCPLSKTYIPVLNKLVKKNHAAFYGIVPGSGYSIKEVAAFSKEFGADFSIFIDKEKKMTTTVRGTTTPECILLNEDGFILYRGLIDNRTFSLGKQGKGVTEKHLEIALSRIHAGKPILVSTTNPVGCLINNL